jgi:hypothetical protein
MQKFVKKEFPYIPKDFPEYLWANISY